MSRMIKQLDELRDERSVDDGSENGALVAKDARCDPARRWKSFWGGISIHGRSTFSSRHESMGTNVMLKPRWTIVSSVVLWRNMTAQLIGLVLTVFPKNARSWTWM